MNQNRGKDKKSDVRKQLLGLLAGLVGLTGASIGYFVRLEPRLSGWKVPAFRIVVGLLIVVGICVLGRWLYVLIQDSRAQHQPKTSASEDEPLDNDSLRRLLCRKWRPHQEDSTCCYYRAVLLQLKWSKTLKKICRLLIWLKHRLDVEFTPLEHCQFLMQLTREALQRWCKHPTPTGRQADTALNVRWLSMESYAMFITKLYESATPSRPDMQAHVTEERRRGVEFAHTLLANKREYEQKWFLTLIGAFIPRLFLNPPHTLREDARRLCPRLFCPIKSVDDLNAWSEVWQHTVAPSGAFMSVGRHLSESEFTEMIALPLWKDFETACELGVSDLHKSFYDLNKGFEAWRDFVAAIEEARPTSMTTASPLFALMKNWYDRNRGWFATGSSLPMWRRDVDEMLLKFKPPPGA